MRKPSEFHRARFAELGDLLDLDPRWLHARVDAAADRSCRDLAPEDYFPPDGRRFFKAELLAERDRVERLCHGCPVRNECLAGALLRGETFGSWGGVAQPDYQTLQRMWRDQLSSRQGAA
jgi:hypothetical protein